MTQYNDVSIAQLIDGPNDGPSHAAYVASLMHAYLREHPGAPDEDVLWACSGSVLDSEGEPPDWATEVLAHVRRQVAAGLPGPQLGRGQKPLDPAPP